VVWRGGSAKHPVVHFSSGRSRSDNTKHPVVQSLVGGRCSIRFSNSAGSYAHDPWVEERAHTEAKVGRATGCQRTVLAFSEGWR